LLSPVQVTLDQPFITALLEGKGTRDHFLLAQLYRQAVAT
jgi:hypothetical protein